MSAVCELDVRFFNSALSTIKSFDIIDKSPPISAFDSNVWFVAFITVFSALTFPLISTSLESTLKIFEVISPAVIFPSDAKLASLSITAEIMFNWLPLMYAFLALTSKPVFLVSTLRYLIFEPTSSLAFKLILSAFTLTLSASLDVIFLAEVSTTLAKLSFSEESLKERISLIFKFSSDVK